RRVPNAAAQARLGPAGPVWTSWLSPCPPFAGTVRCPSQCCCGGSGPGRLSGQRRNALGVELRGLGVYGVVADAVMTQEAPSLLALCQLFAEVGYCEIHRLGLEVL